MPSTWRAGIFEIESVRAEDVRVENALESIVPRQYVRRHLGQRGSPRTRAILRWRSVRFAACLSKAGGRSSRTFIDGHHGCTGSRASGVRTSSSKRKIRPVTEFYTEAEILAMFDGFEIEETAREHYRALPVARRGTQGDAVRAGLSTGVQFNPRISAKWLAYKLSVTAIKL